ncbi:MAG: dTDP-4-dehydrorhamnose reductase [Pseudomonadota bacterium]
MTAITAARPIVVIGKSGQLAEALVRRAGERGVALVTGGRPEVDLTDSETLKAFVFETKPSVVVNAAAYTAVDQAESDAEAAFALNGEGPARLAALCAAVGVPLIHISTDFVFSGLTDVPYPHDAAPSPLGIYGTSKAAGEVGVRLAHPQHVIVRTSWLYGSAGRNFPKTMLRLGADKGEVRVVDDQVGSPTFADDLADALLVVAERISDSEDAQLFGTFHFSNSGHTTWCGFANAVFERAASAGRPRATAHPITTHEYPTPAKRPIYSVMDCRRFTDVYGVVPRPWDEALGAAMPGLLAG